MNSNDQQLIDIESIVRDFANQPTGDKLVMAFFFEKMAALLRSHVAIEDAH
jgi:c-di-GMP-binding flagellar brake protein YcgR